jgi:hypothetical protein
VKQADQKVHHRLKFSRRVLFGYHVSLLSEVFQTLLDDVCYRVRGSVRNSKLEGLDVDHWKEGRRGKAKDEMAQGEGQRGRTKRVKWSC